MNPKAISKISKRTWARANKLAELAGIEPTAARHFLVDCDDNQKALLDNGTDLRSKALRNLISEATTGWTTNAVPESHRSSCCKVTDTESGVTYVAETGEIPEVPLDLLYDLKNLIDKYDEDTVTQGLGVLAFLKS